MKYIFPAVFEPAEEGGYCVNFPDITDHTSYGCFTDGDDVAEALYNAGDALSLVLWQMEEDGAEIPAPSSLSALEVPKGGFVNLIAADTQAYREMYDTKAVRKNVTIPHWLDVMAAKRKINFSQVLQNALREELHV